MKRINTIIVAMIMVMTLSQCKKEEPITPADEGVYITLNVKDDNGSRVIVNTTTGTVDFENGDKIYVASGGKYVGTLTYEGSLFTGSVFNAVAGYPLHFYFLGNITPAETLTYGETDSCSVVITDQTEHLPVISYAPSTENYGMTTDFTSHLLNKCALVKFDVTSTSESATCVTGFKNKVTVNFAENTLTPTQEGDGIITLPAGTGERWAILLPQGALAAGGVGSAYSADDAYTGTRGAVPAIGLNAFLTVGIPVTLEAGGGGGGNHEYVDLGLPSGTLWATCNVGANASEEYGDYFAWGETEPKDVYNWSTYQYCNGGSSKLTKYCNNSSYGYNGFTDNLTILQPYDDAATVNWGNNWRIPTSEEWRELLQNTTCIWTIQNGVYGRLFTAINGNSLFLPAAGSRHESSLYYVGSDGNYWSSSLYTNYPECAWDYYYLDSEFHNLSYYSRFDGFSVRAVYSLEQDLSHITATANPSEGGEISGNGPYIIGSTCTLIATANEGYTFDNWTENDNQVSTDANYTFTVTGDRTLVANFAVQAPNNYTISVSANPSNGGIVTGGGTFQQGQTCTLIATANTGYTFTNWTRNGEVVSTTPTFSVTVTESATYVAHFSVNSYEITTTANPTNGGTVTGAGTYNYGTTATLRATANVGYIFINWTKDSEIISTVPNVSLTVTESAAYVAHFSQNIYEIIATADPSNGGTVTGSDTYTYGAMAILTATANAGYIFTNWTRNGVVVSTIPTFSVTVTESADYVAHFSQNSYEITATANPTNGGTVTGAGTYTYGATCTLTATANPDYTFVNWTSNGEVVSTTSTFSVTVTESAIYVAHFSNSYEITATANPANGGTIIGAGTYTYGATCTLTAVANAGYTFINWTRNGEVVSTTPTFSVTVTESDAYVAHFSVNSYEITVTANPIYGGIVIGAGTFIYGATATLRATANAGYTFINWTSNGEVVSTSPIFSVAVTESAAYVAHFSQNSYEITATANPTNGGTVTGAGTYTYGATCTLTATANTGYTFINWTRNGEVVSTTPTFNVTVTESDAYVAHFSLNSSR